MECFADVPCRSCKKEKQKCRFYHDDIRIKAHASLIHADVHHNYDVVFYFLYPDGVRSGFFSSIVDMERLLMRRGISTDNVRMIYIDDMRKPFYSVPVLGTFPRNPKTTDSVGPRGGSSESSLA